MHIRQARHSKADPHKEMHIGDGPVIPRKLEQPWVGEVAPSIFRFGTTYIGCYAIEHAGAYIFIDTGLPGYWEQIFGFLASRNAPLSAVHAVVLTHHHADHIGNAERLRKEAGAKVFIHSHGLAAVLRKAKPSTYFFPIWKPAVFKYMLHAMRSGATRTLALVEATAFVDGEVLDLPGRPRLIHTPGHTSGHAAIMLEDRQPLFVGDALATIDIESGEPGPHLVPRFVNEDDEAALRSLARIEEVNARWLLPGHGVPWEGTPRQAVELAMKVAALHR